MTIYFDAHLVQFYADFEEFMYGEHDEVPETHHPIKKELWALRRLMELDDLTDWRYAAPKHLLDELHSGRPTEAQKRTYAALSEAWEMAGDDAPTEDEVSRLDATLVHLGLKDNADRRHLAEAVALGASFFLTNDGDVVKKARGNIRGLQVGRPSECLVEMSRGLFIG